MSLDELPICQNLGWVCRDELLTQEMTHRASVRCAIRSAMSIMRSHLLRAVPVVIMRTPMTAHGWGMAGFTTSFARYDAAALVVMVVEAVGECDGQQVVDQQYECRGSMPVHLQTSAPPPIRSCDRKQTGFGFRHTQGRPVRLHNINSSILPALGVSGQFLILLARHGCAARYWQVRTPMRMQGNGYG